MNSRHTKQFFIFERCVYAGNIALNTIGDFLDIENARKLYRLLLKNENKNRKVRNINKLRNVYTAIKGKVLAMWRGIMFKPHNQKGPGVK